MFFEEPIRRWQITKYKQIKRDGRVEEPVSLVLDQNRKRLSVYFFEEELEQVYYNMEVSKYPILRFSDHYLYILFNGQGQGFRLTFLPDQKLEFMGIMRRLAYISESPAKRRLFAESARPGPWTARQAAPSSWSSSSQPSSSMLPMKRVAARNLAASFSFTAPTNRPSSSSSSISSANPFSRPESSASSASRASGASRVSRASRISSSRPESSGSFSPDPFLSLKPAAAKVIVKEPVKETDNKCIQTDGTFENILETLAKDPNFSTKCLAKVMEENKFGELVQKMREEIRKMPKEQLEELEKKTRPETSKNDAPIPEKRSRTPRAAQNSSTQNTNTQSTSASFSSSIPTRKSKKTAVLVRRQTSDLEYDIFEDREQGK